MRQKFKDSTLPDSPRQPPLYFDQDGNPISMKEWCILFENMYYKRINYTPVFAGRRVSTVWLGLAHGVGENLDFFETMVFDRDSFDDLDMDRYSTKEEAIAGHKRMVERWRNGTPTAQQDS